MRPRSLLQPSSPAYSQLARLARPFAYTRRLLHASRPLPLMADPGSKAASTFDKSNFDQLMLKRFFFTPSFDIYGGVAGLYDYGPPGSALQANVLNAWRRHFIVEEDMLELDTTIMTLASVLETSGHVAKFADWMVKDVKTGEIFRADHLVEAVLEARYVVRLISGSTAAAAAPARTPRFLTRHASPASPLLIAGSRATRRPAVSPSPLLPMTRTPRRRRRRSRRPRSSSKTSRSRRSSLSSPR
jgi:hypothetical protein